MLARIKHIWTSCIQIVPTRLSGAANKRCMHHLIVSKRHDTAAAEQSSAAGLGSKINNHLCSADSKAKAEEVKSSQGQHRPQQAYPKSTPPHIWADPHHILLAQTRSQCLPQHLMTCNTKTVLCYMQPSLCLLVSSTSSKAEFMLDQAELEWGHMHLLGPCHCDGPVDNASDE